MQPTNQIKIAQNLCTEGKYADALAVITALLIQFDHKPALYLWAGQCVICATFIDLGIKLFQFCLQSVSSTKIIKIQALESLVKTYLNQNNYQEAYFYAKELRQLAADSAVAAIAECEYKCANYFVDKQLEQYIKNIINQCKNKELLSYLKLQSSRIQVLLGDKQIENSFEDLGNSAFMYSLLYYDVYKREQKNNNVDNIILPSQTKAIFKILDGDISTENLQLSKNLFLNLYCLFDKNGTKMFAFEQVQQFLIQILNRFQYLIINNFEFKILNFVIEMEQDWVGQILKLQFGQILHNLALYFWDQFLKTKDEVQKKTTLELLISSLYVKMGEKFSYNQMEELMNKLIAGTSTIKSEFKALFQTTDCALETQLFVAIVLQNKQIAINVYVNTLQSNMFSNYREHICMISSQVIGEQAISILLRKKSLKEFLDKSTPQFVLHILSQLNLSDFELLQEIKQTINESKYLEDPIQANKFYIVQCFILAQKITYIQTQKIMVEYLERQNKDASKVNKSITSTYPLYSVDKTVLQKTKSLLKSQLEQKQQDLSKLLLLVLSKPCTTEVAANMLICLLALLITTQYIDIDQYSYCRKIFSEIEKDLRPKERDALEMHLCILAQRLKLPFKQVYLQLDSVESKIFRFIQVSNESIKARTRQQQQQSQIDVNTKDESKSVSFGTNISVSQYDGVIREYNKLREVITDLVKDYPGVAALLDEVSESVMPNYYAELALSSAAMEHLKVQQSEVQEQEGLLAEILKRGDWVQ